MDVRNQIAQRAIDSGLVGRFGTLDPTTGGETSRFSLSGEWAKRWASAQTKANVWWLKSSLDLWSNFQYCLNDYARSGTCDTGDQFKQGERRQAGGFALSHTVFDRWGLSRSRTVSACRGGSTACTRSACTPPRGGRRSVRSARTGSPSVVSGSGRRTKRDGPVGSVRSMACVPMPTTSTSMPAWPPIPAGPATRW